ncbi:transposase [Clostridium tyrobutyricum]|uniref:transposase n=1 Tax=Clostridium tyrobutyricum TaxID=1519 RepID=UPI003969C580
MFLGVGIQNCIIHQIMNSIKYIASEDKNEFMRDLKFVYKAPNEEIAINGLDTNEIVNME